MARATITEKRTYSRLSARKAALGALTADTSGPDLVRMYELAEDMQREGSSAQMTEAGQALVSVRAEMQRRGVLAEFERSRQVGISLGDIAKGMALTWGIGYALAFAGAAIGPQGAAVVSSGGSTAAATAAAETTAAATAATSTTAVASTTAGTAAVKAVIDNGGGEIVNTSFGTTLNSWLQDAGAVITSVGGIQTQLKPAASAPAAQTMQSNGVMNSGISSSTIVLVVVAIIAAKVLL